MKLNLEGFMVVQIFLLLWFQRIDQELVLSIFSMDIRDLLSIITIRNTGLWMLIILLIELFWLLKWLKLQKLLLKFILNIIARCIIIGTFKSWSVISHFEISNYTKVPTLMQIGKHFSSFKLFLKWIFGLWSVYRLCKPIFLQVFSSFMIWFLFLVNV